MTPQFGHFVAMKTLIDFIAALVAALAALAISQIGIDLTRNAKPVEITRVPLCDVASNDSSGKAPSPEC